MIVTGLLELTYEVDACLKKLLTNGIEARLLGRGKQWVT